jgi:hypothetical protein
MYNRVKNSRVHLNVQTRLSQYVRDMVDLRVDFWVFTRISYDIDIRHLTKESAYYSLSACPTKLPVSRFLVK